jgi:hypothetical protein
MPKVKKIYTEPVYARVKPVNDKFLRNVTDKNGVSISFYLDTFLERVRKGDITFQVERPMTMTEKKLLARHAS